MFNTENLREAYLQSENNSDIKSALLAENSFRDAAIIAKTQLSSQAYSPALEAWLKARLNIGPAVNETSGDGVWDKQNIEIKVSLGGKSGQFNFVQIRPDHDIDGYLFVTYSIWNDEVTWFYVSPNDMNDLILEFGGYAHGTIKALGKITEDNIKGRNCEYALRPDPHKKSGKARACWDALVRVGKKPQSFFISEKPELRIVA